MRGGGEDDGLELGVGQLPLGDDAAGQLRAGGRGPVAHGAHRGGLDEGRGMGPGAVDADGGGGPEVVGAVVVRGVAVVSGWRAVVLDILDVSPVMRRGRCGWRVGLPAAFALRGGRGRGRGGGRGGSVGPGLADGGCGAAGRQAFEGLFEESGRGVEWIRAVSAGFRGGLGIGGRGLLDDGQARLVRGASALIELPGDRRGEEDVGRGLASAEEHAPAAGGVGAFGRGDRDEAPPRAEGAVGGVDVPQVGLRLHGSPPGGAGERRVHDHEGRVEVREGVGDVLCVVAGDVGGGERELQEAAAGRGELVEGEAAARGGVEGEGGEHGEGAGPGGGLEDDVVGAGGRGRGDGPGDRERRRELLVALLHVVAAGLCGLEGGELLDEPEHPGGAAGLRQHRGAVSLQEQGERDLCGVVGLLPGPGSGCVGAAEGRGHGGLDGFPVHRAAGLEAGQEGLGGGEDLLGRGGWGWS